MLKKFNDLLSKAILPLSLKLITLLAFIILITIGFSATSAGSAITSEIGNTNLGNLIVWSYWWPLIIFVSIFFGRIWCMVCPVEPITSFFSKIGLRLKRPKWLMSGWAITVFYMIILFVGIEGFAIDHNPFYMAIYMLAILAVSILTGLLYEKNTFCRYICPVGYMLGLHARLSFYGWRVKDKMICEQCPDKSCIHSKYIYNQNFKSCGVDLYPAEITGNSVCILCTGCRKTCASYKTEKNHGRPNPAYTFIGFANDLFRIKPLVMAEMFFLWILSGFVISENMEGSESTEALMKFIPDSITSLFQIHSNFLNGFIYAVIAFLIMPVFFWFIPLLVSKLAGVKMTLKDYILNYSLAFIPVMAAAHLGKSILQSTSDIPYLKVAFADARGITTAKNIINGQKILQENPGWVNVFSWIVFCLIMLVGVFLSIKVISLVNQKFQQTLKSGKGFYLIPVVYGSVFLGLLILWRWF
jgi:polyferredoxin